LSDRGRSPIEIVPARFTLSELQHVHEAVLGRRVDKRNFRTRLLARGLVEPVAAARKTGRHRPAQLFRFTGTPDATEPVRGRRTRASKRVR
jgi:8-oxo-dGTP diphosphatase